MKGLFIIIFLLALIAGGYFYFTQQEDFEIIDSKVELKQIGGGMNFETPSVTALRFSAGVNGSIKNISDEKYSNILLTFKIGNDQVSAKIRELNPDQTISFTTNKIETKNKTPKHSLVSITHD